MFSSQNQVNWKKLWDFINIYWLNLIRILSSVYILGAATGNHFFHSLAFCSSFKQSDNVDKLIFTNTKNVMSLFNMWL